MTDPLTDDRHPAPADRPIADLYHQHYTRLVRIAWLLLRDQGRAEEVVQDAFVDLHQRWERLSDHGEVTGYLRTSVVNRCRSAHRHQLVVRRHAPGPPADAASAEHGALLRVEQDRIIAAINRLPPRQREVLVLRYYGQLSEAEIAATLGISRGAVKSHSSRGLRSLRPVLGEQE